MSIPTNHKEVISLLRSADIATLYFYSQHMAEVISNLSDQLVTFRAFIESIDSVSFENLNEPLTKISLSAIVDEQTLNGFIEAMKQDWIEE